MSPPAAGSSPRTSSPSSPRSSAGPGRSSKRQGATAGRSSERPALDFRDARAPAELRVLRPRSTAGQRARADLHLRMHVLRRLRRESARREVPELRWQLRPAANPSAGAVGEASGVDDPRRQGTRTLLPRAPLGSPQSPRRSSRKRLTDQAPSAVLESTVCVTPERGSCTERNETPASQPSRLTTSVEACSQKPRP